MYLHFALTTIVFVGYYVSGNSVEGWIATPSVSRQSRASIVSVGHQQSFGYIDTSLGAGFGASASAGSAKNNNDGNKLKPKQQWDRYMNDLKKMDKIRVGVRVEGGEGENNDWIEAGHIKSLDNLYTEVAVVRQRALIADVSTKDKLQWGYTALDSEEWVVVDKSIDVPDKESQIDRKIGFEGTPDPNTGYYCVYNEGRLVNMADITLDLKPSSKSKKRQ